MNERLQALLRLYLAVDEAYHASSSRLAGRLTTAGTFKLHHAIRDLLWWVEDQLKGSAV